MDNIATKLNNFAKVVSLAVLSKWYNDGSTTDGQGCSQNKIAVLSHNVKADVLNMAKNEPNITKLLDTTVIAAMATVLHRYTQLEEIGITCQIEPIGENSPVRFKVVTVKFSSVVSFHDACGQVAAQLSEITTFDDNLLQSLICENYVENDVVKNLFRFGVTNVASNIPSMHAFEFILKFQAIIESENFRSLSLTIYYDTFMYNENQIGQILANISTILLNGFLNPDQSVQKLTILSPAERERVLVEFNNINRNGLVNVNPAGGIVEIFLENIVKRPCKLAVFEDYGVNITALTYSALHKRALALAIVIQNRHFQASMSPVLNQTFIAVVLSQGVNYITVCLGCLILGKSVASIHYTFDTKQIQDCLDVLGNPLLITDRKKWESMNISYDDVLIMDDYIEIISDIKHYNNEILLDIPMDDNMASYCFFTSGSTGTPKPVHLTVKGMVNTIKCVAEHCVNGENTKSMLVTPSGRGLSYLELWGSFYVGATVYIPPEDVRIDMDKLRRWLYSYNITNLALSTSLAETLVSCPPEKQIYLSTLNWILIGGEKCHKMDLRSRHYHFTCTMMYGSSETCPVTEYTMESGKIHMDPPVGYTLKNASVYVLDNWLNPVPVGVKGDIYSSGIGLMHGYVNQPELTASVFLPNPFCEGLLMFRTGDVGRWLPDGALNVSGRKIAQMSLSGLKLDLGDVEGVLKEFPGVEQSMVVLREVGKSKQMIGFCTLKQDVQDISKSDLYEFLQTRLQNHAIPRSIYFVTYLPRNASGKILRRRLTQFLDEQNISPTEMVNPN